MKVEFLKNLGLEDETIKAIQAESGKDVTAAKTAMQSQIDTLTGQVTELQGQVTQRDTDIKDITSKLEAAGQSATKLGEVQTTLNNLQAKYDADTQAYQKKLEDQNYEFKIRERVSKVDFSCNAAKNEFVHSLMTERLPVKDGDIMGFDDYLAKQKEADPGAFKVETPPTPPADPRPNPQFSTPPNPNNQTPPPSGSSFGFNFVGVRKHD